VSYKCQSESEFHSRRDNPSNESEFERQIEMRTQLMSYSDKYFTYDDLVGLQVRMGSLLLNTVEDE
jgi:hypothetical protein